MRITAGRAPLHAAATPTATTTGTATSTATSTTVATTSTTAATTTTPADAARTQPSADTGRAPHADIVQDAHRDVLLAVQHGLSANWDEDRPRVAVVERNGLATVYVSTIRTLNPAVRADIRGAVRAALAPYIPLAPYTAVVFLRRGRP